MKNNEENNTSNNTTPTNGSRKNIEKPDVIIDVRKFQTFLEILDSPTKAFKILVAALVLTIAIFASLAFVVISIKTIYPYNEIKTNMFGATTMQNEDVELTYWLFNTAEMWANSGIRVEKGDILTIRASGKSNTAIHHLVNAVEKNRRLSKEWAGTEGHLRMEPRMEYRIYPQRNPDALIMQVIPEDAILYENNHYNVSYISPNFPDETDCKTDYSNYNNYYHIGKERIDLRIAQDGILYFSINDIVLTKNCIAHLQDAIFDINRTQYNRYKAQLALLDSIASQYNQYANHLNKRLGINELTSNDVDSLLDIYNQEKIVPALSKISLGIDFVQYCQRWQKDNASSLNFGKHPIPLNAKICDKIANESAEGKDLISGGLPLPFYNELHYYRDSDYYNAWFDDNVGSFLIIVEKSKEQNR